MIPGLNILKKIFKTSNERKLVEIQPLVHKIDSLEPEIQKLSDQELKNKTQEFKKRIKKQALIRSNFGIEKKVCDGKNSFVFFSK